MVQAKRDLTPATPAPPSAAQPAVSREATHSRVRQRYVRLAWFMAATDALCLLSALLLAYLIRFGNIPIPGEFAALMAVGPFVWVGVFRGFRLYDIQHLSAAEEFRRTVGATAIGITALVTGSFWFHASISRLWLGLTLVLSLLFVVLVRRGWRRALARMRGDGRLAYLTLVIGTNTEGQKLAEVIRQPDLGFRPIGAVRGSEERGSSKPTRRRVLDLANPPLEASGSIDRLEDLVRKTGAECLYVASSAVNSDDMRRIMRVARQTGTELRVSSNLTEVLSTRLTTQPIGDVMTMSLKPVRLTGTQAAIKRAFDLTASGLGILVAIPVFAIIGLAVKLNSPGPIFFKQERVGRRGVTFTILKFRSMRSDAARITKALQTTNKGPAAVVKLRDDPRVTSVGRFLRRSSLDELPQLINVLKGDLSLVGPRPLQRVEMVEFDDWHAPRLEVRPGLTGLWQISGRNDVSFDDRIRMDLFYIENWSLPFDLYILAKTIPALLSRRGAF